MHNGLAYGGNFLPTLIGLVIVLFIIFLIFRRFFCWYWKINERIKNQERIITLLEQINFQLSNSNKVNANKDIL